YQRTRPHSLLIAPSSLVPLLAPSHRAFARAYSTGLARVDIEACRLDAGGRRNPALVPSNESRQTAARLLTPMTRDGMRRGHASFGVPRERRLSCAVRALGCGCSTAVGEPRDRWQQ